MRRTIDAPDFAFCKTIMTRTFTALFACLTLAACATKPIAKGSVQLGDSERSIVAKMADLGARDATKETVLKIAASIWWNQRSYCWELPDRTIVAVLVAAPPKREKTVVEIATSEPGLGIEGAKNWNSWTSQKIKRQTSLDSP